jgi:hypothetical protein
MPQRTRQLTALDVDNGGFSTVRKASCFPRCPLAMVTANGTMATDLGDE